MFSLFKPKLYAGLMGKYLFDFTVSSKSHAAAMALFSEFSYPIFPAETRDLSLYRLFLPELSTYVRADLAVIRVELMYFTFCVVDFYLMRSSRVRRLHKQRASVVLLAYLNSFKMCIEPSRRSETFLDETEARGRAYNHVWDEMVLKGEGRNRLALEETFLRFCGTDFNTVNIALALPLVTEFDAIQKVVSQMLDRYRLF